MRHTNFTKIYSTSPFYNRNIEPLTLFTHLDCPLVVRYLNYYAFTCLTRGLRKIIQQFSLKVPSPPSPTARSLKMTPFERKEVSLQINLFGSSSPN